MKRGGKKLIYGAGYAALLLALVFVIFRGVIIPTPTCTDGVKNQNEEGIDCGGSCTACAIVNLDPIRAGTVQVFSAGGSSVLLGTLVNPNDAYGSSIVRYEFVVLGWDGREMERVSGSAYLGPGEQRQVYAAGLRTESVNVGRAVLEVTQPNWEAMPASGGSGVTLLSGALTLIAESSISVEGSIRNQSPLSASGIEIIAILKDTLGRELFASETITENLGGLESRSFRILFPRDEELASRVDPLRTEIVVYSR